MRTFRGTKLSRTLALLILALVSAPSFADYTGIRVLPAQSQALAGQDVTLNLVWRINEDGSSNAANSPFLFVINPKDGSQLSGIRSTVDASGGGPFSLTETVTFNANDIDAWIAQGLSFVLLKRTFSDFASGATIDGSLRLNLSSGGLAEQRSAGKGYLEVQDLRLEFDNGNDLIVTQAREELYASLTIRTVGNGLLEGRWQIAEPGSSGQVPIFRTLSLVRKNVQQGQRVSFRSPRLPTSQQGKFLLRFCAQVDRTKLRDEPCLEENLTSLAAYEVQGNDTVGVQAMKVLSPYSDQVDASAKFAWQPLSAAVMYQLQVFELQARDADLPSSKLTQESLEPMFISGMVLPQGTTSTLLSELVKSKLAKGKHYLWRVTAHDASGQLLGLSSEQSFVYR